MTVSDSFLDYLIDQLSGFRDVSARKMFGGAGLYCDGKVFAFVADDMVYFKVDDTNREKYVKAGSKPFQPFPDKPTLMSYFEIPADVLEDSDELIKWADESLSIQKLGVKSQFIHINKL